MKLNISTIPKNEKLLRTISRSITIEELRSPKVQTFIDDLLETAQNAETQEGWRSAGLAAVQVGNPMRIFVIHEFRSNAWSVFVNPDLGLLGEAQDTHQESCLSIPGVVADVSRHKRVRINYLDRFGESKTEKQDGFQARIIQHEYDHLDGILFTDRSSLR